VSDAPDVTVLSIDHTEVGFTEDVTGVTVAMPTQSSVNLEMSTPTGRLPSAKHAGLNFKLFTERR
jgi:hypothetical protein